MERRVSHFTLAALFAVGLAGCATDYDGPPYYTATEPAQPVVIQPVIQPQPPVVVQPLPPTIEGQVVRNEGDAYVIQEPSGRQTRVYLNRNTPRDNIAVGDYVIVRFEGPLESAYASSIIRRSVSPAPVVVPSVVVPLPRPQTIEGVVHSQFGNDYEIKDISGREVRLHVDSTTKRDGNVTVGDKVVATTSLMPADVQYTNVYRLGNPYVFPGEVVRIDDNWYVIRDFSGRTVRVHVDDMTKRDGRIAVGDRVVVLTSAMPSDVRHATHIYRLANSNIVQGEVVRIDGNCYAVRDVTGREVCLYTNTPTIWHDTIVVGDRIIAYNGPSSTMHVDTLAKR